MHPGMHGTTFGGGPLACAVAIAVIDTIKSDDLLQHVTVVGTYFRNGLTALQVKHPAIVEVRGKGLMLAAELNSAELAKAVLTQLLERRILINRTDETVLRFLPPFILERQHVDATLAAIDDILTQLEAAAGQHAQEAATAIPGGR
jgi:acetylornithine aminotransferase/acetylornithine/N-succinyldiaminopimelate aminotransferase